MNSHGVEISIAGGVAEMVCDPNPMPLVLFLVLFLFLFFYHILILFLAEALGRSNKYKNSM